MSASISDRNMYASSGFTHPEDMPEYLKKMDDKERSIIEDERRDIEEYPSNHIGIGTIYGTITGTLTGFTIGALTANPAAPVIGAIGGGIVGYKTGRIADRSCCPQILEEVAEYNAHIPEQRLNRVKDKIEEIQEARQNTTDEKEKKKLERAEEHFQVVKSNATFKNVVNPY